MKRVISVTIDEDVVEGIDQMAATLGLSRSAVVEMYCRAVFGGAGSFESAVDDLAVALKRRYSDSVSVPPSAQLA